MQKTILIADDHPEIRTLVRITLSSDGFNVAECKTAPEAVALAKKISPHLILMDIDMPGEYNGITATQILSTDPETIKSPVIMLTASKDLQDDSLRSGAVAYLTKPFSPLALLKHVQLFARNN
ncbi:response regulator [Halodesulfovibrio aestuarii]|uniref:PleD family two-component system response regulator n=1 Tax=Halodesulfovibrio aestuarii TaxID=126333 RepID=A0A8G2FB29_9BACT|nr:response regulator [Halodesulfovibrio aestuarii]SHJ08462.1 Response regulator receiver domain-containing protein [Halodesulfovibrio aestuarii]